jgi:hypothetical protein
MFVHPRGKQMLTCEALFIPFAFVKSLAAFLVLLAVAGCSTDSRTPVLVPYYPEMGPFTDFLGNYSQPPVLKAQRATVRAVLGTVQQWNGEVWTDVHRNMELTNGTRIRTLDQSSVLLSVNGLTSSVKLTEDTELEIKETMGESAQAESWTVLELRKGTILGSVGKRSVYSSFQVRGGGIMAEVRIGEFQMSAEGRVEVNTGAVSVTADGRTLRLRRGVYFDAITNEVGRSPDPPPLASRGPYSLP